jgi:catechol 2,3-dioxygenase
MLEISPYTKVLHVKLNVYSIERSVLFYEELLGFKAARKTDESAILSANRNSLIHLSRVDKKQRTIEEDQLGIRRAGLFHFAILLPSRNDLANVFKHLSDNSDRFRFDGAADHLVSESLYLRDPDYNGVEIYRDRDQSDWERTGPFQVKMSTKPLDLDKLYSEANDSEKWNMPKRQ